MNIVSSRYRYDVEYSTMLSEFLQVPGTPASGKSMLAKLLSLHIRAEEPDVHVIWIIGWKDNDVAKSGDGNLTSKQERLDPRQGDGVYF